MENKLNYKHHKIYFEKPEKMQKTNRRNGM